jgi:hypothetical protein
MMCLQVGPPSRHARTAAEMLDRFITFRPFVNLTLDRQYLVLIPAGRRPDSIEKQLRLQHSCLRLSLVDLDVDGVPTFIKELEPS